MGINVEKQLLDRAELLSEPYRSQCMTALNSANLAKEGSAVISFKLKATEVVNMYELCNYLCMDKSKIIKGAIKSYDKRIINR